MLAGLMERQAAKDEDHSTRLTALKAKLPMPKVASAGSTPQSKAASPI